MGLQGGELPVVYKLTETMQKDTAGATDNYGLELYRFLLSCRDGTKASPNKPN